jgi:hypothetical protein
VTVLDAAAAERGKLRRVLGRMDTVFFLISATTAIRAICQPGVPPTTTVWTSTGGVVVPTGEVVTPDPGGGTCMANAGVAPNATRAPASPASTAANRRMRLRGFMTISFDF